MSDGVLGVLGVVGRLWLFDGVVGDGYEELRRRSKKSDALTRSRTRTTEDIHSATDGPVREKKRAYRGGKEWDHRCTWCWQDHADPRARRTPASVVVHLVCLMTPFLEVI